MSTPELLLDGLKRDPLIQSITQVIVTGKKLISNGDAIATGDAAAGEAAKEDLQKNWVKYGSSLMIFGNLRRGGNPLAKPGTLPPAVFSSKAPKQVTPGITTKTGQHINDQGRVESWVAHYDVHGRLVGRTDYNAGNKTEGIPSTHHNKYEYGPGKNCPR